MFGGFGNNCLPLHRQNLERQVDVAEQAAFILPA